MADRLAGGNLAATLTELAGTDLTAGQIADRLDELHPGVEVSSVTVRNWIAALNDEPV